MPCSGWRRLIVAMLCVSLALPACTTLRAVPMPVGNSAMLAQEVHSGDRVRVTLHSGEQKAFKVTSVSANALLGKGVRIPFEDIRNLERRESSTGKTSLMVVSVVAGAAAILFAYLLSRLGDSE